MTFLDGGGAALFGELFAGEYLSATLRMVTDGYDAQGNLQRASAPRACRVQIDRVTERMVRAEGYTATDVALYILSRPGGALPGIDALDTSAQVTVNAGRYAGRTFKLADPIDSDPAGAYWLCRGVAA